MVGANPPTFFFVSNLLIVVEDGVMDRLMRKSQDYAGGVSTVVLTKSYSVYNPGQVKNNQYKAVYDWGSACFAHLPSMLEAANHTHKIKGKDVFDDSDIVEILFLPYITPSLRRPIRDSLDYLNQVMRFMGVEEKASEILKEGWSFKLHRSGPWNVAVCTLIRYLSEYPDMVHTFLYMRRELRLPFPKALFLMHFLVRRDERWSRDNAPGGHTILFARGATFAQFKELAKWRDRDKDLSILESCDYQGINKLFGSKGGYNAAEAGPNNVIEMLDRTGIRNNADVIAFAKLLTTSRGKKDEDTDSKPARVRGSAGQKARMDDGQLGINVMPGGVIHGGIGRGPFDVHVQAAPINRKFIIKGPV